MAGFSPYQQAAQQGYQQQNPYGGGMGMGGRYGGYSRYRPNLGGAVTGPTGNGGTGGGEMGQDREAAQAQMRTRGAAADDSIARQVAGGQANAEQNAQGIKDYRTAKNNGIGNDNQNTIAAQRVQATQLGIDPSSDAATIAGAASGKTGFDAQGMPTGAGTAQALPTGSAGVAQAAATAQAAKDGTGLGAAQNAYAGGYNATQPSASPSSSYAAGAPSPAMPGMPPLTLNMPPPVNPGTVTPPSVGGTSTPAAPGLPALPKPNAPLKPSAIKPFGSPATQPRRSSMAAMA